MNEQDSTPKGMATFRVLPMVSKDGLGTRSWRYFHWSKEPVKYTTGPETELDCRVMKTDFICFMIDLDLPPAHDHAVDKSLRLFSAVTKTRSKSHQLPNTIAASPDGQTIVIPVFPGSSRRLILIFIDEFHELHVTPDPEIKNSTGGNGDDPARHG